MSKKHIILILAVVTAIILILSAVGIYFRPKSRLQESPPVNIEVPRNLTAEERKIYEDRLAQGYEILNQYQNNASTTPADFFKVYMHIGFQYYGLGKLTLAEEAYKKAAGFDPRNYNAYTALYTLYLETGENDKALQAIQKAIELAPEKPDVWRKLIELKRDKLGASSEELNGIFQEAIQKTSEHVDIIKLYAQFLENVGQYQKAWELWNVLHNHYPQEEIYQREMDRLEKLKERQ